MMQSTLPLACFLSIIRPPGIQFENSLLQIAPVDKAKCPYIWAKNDIGFQLYTRYNPTVYQHLELDDDEKLYASNINFNDPTVIYFHAFMENPDDGSAVMIRESYVHRGDTNIIMVDASRLEAGPWYFTAAENTWYIGRFAARFIDYLVSRGLDLSKTHLIGHSLGAQAAGVAGASIESGRISRITGLDPALPLFSKLPLQQRLDPTDAEFVDVIHTDAGIFGVSEPTGHVDFYPNGGISPQPGCELEVVLHQYQLLNKCENDTKTQGFYTFYLAVNMPSKRAELIQTKMMKLFNYIRNIRRQSGEEADKPRKDTAEKLKTNSHNTEMKIKITNPTSSVKSVKKHTKFDSAKQSKTVDTARKGAAYITQEAKTNPRHTVQTETATNTFDPEITPYDTQNHNTEKSHVVKRQKRFLPFLKRSEASESDNFLFKMLEFLLKNRKNVVPVFTVMREINTLVKSANGELNHVAKERNNYIGATPPLQVPVTYSLELGNENKAMAFVKRLLGLGVKGDKLTISGSGK